MPPTTEGMLDPKLYVLDVGIHVLGYDRVLDLEAQIESHIELESFPCIIKCDTDSEDCALSGGYCCLCEIAQQSIRRHRDNISIYALKTRAVFPPGAQVDTPSIDELANRAGMNYVVATSDWPDLSHLVTLVIKTKKRRATVFLRQYKTNCSHFAISLTGVWNARR